MINNKASAIPQLCLGLVMMSLMIAGASAQPDTDHAMGIPQVMVVGDVDIASGRLELDGRMYRVDEQLNSQELSRSRDARPLQLSELEPGMEVLVSTDGTMPDEGHQPRIMGLWEPQ